MPRATARIHFSADLLPHYTAHSLSTNQTSLARSGSASANDVLFGRWVSSFFPSTTNVDISGDKQKKTHAYTKATIYTRVNMLFRERAATLPRARCMRASARANMHDRAASHDSKPRARSAEKSWRHTQMARTNTHTPTSRFPLPAVSLPLNPDPCITPALPALLGAENFRFIVFGE